MPPRFLSVPGNTLPSGYGASIANLRALYAALEGVSQDVAINQAGEGFSVEMPNLDVVANFINGGGVYIDYTGWPMWYYWVAAEGGWFTSDSSPGGTPSHPDQTILNFLSAIGVDPGYIKTFNPGNCGIFDPDYVNCVPCTFSGYPYDRGAVSTYEFPASNSVIIAPESTARASCTWNGQTYNVYSVIAIKSTTGGWYFYAYSNTNGKAVSPTIFANFIRQVLGYSAISGGGSSGGGGSGGTSGGGTGSIGAGGPAPTSSGGSGFLSSLTTGEKIAGAAAILALVLGGVLLFSGGE